MSNSNTWPPPPGHRLVRKHPYRAGIPHADQNACITELKTLYKCRFLSPFTRLHVTEVLRRFNMAPRVNQPTADTWGEHGSNEELESALKRCIDLENVFSQAMAHLQFVLKSRALLVCLPHTKPEAISPAMRRIHNKLVAEGGEGTLLQRPFLFGTLWEDFLLRVRVENVKMEFWQTRAFPADGQPEDWTIPIPDNWHALLFANMARLACWTDDELMERIRGEGSWRNPKIWVHDDMMPGITEFDRGIWSKKLSGWGIMLGAFEWGWYPELWRAFYMEWSCRNQQIKKEEEYGIKWREESRTMSAESVSPSKSEEDYSEIKKEKESNFQGSEDADGGEEDFYFQGWKDSDCREEY